MSMPDTATSAESANGTGRANARIMSFADAIREGLAEAMERDPAVFLMGEGIADPASFFGTTKGLRDRFGAEVVAEVPAAGAATRKVLLDIFSALTHWSIVSSLVCK